METKDARRRRNLLLLIEATDGGLDAIVVMANLNPEYLKQIIKGVLLPRKKDGTRSARSLGDAAAEAIEDAYNLGRGWFDSDRPVPAIPAHKVEQTISSYGRSQWPFASIKPEQYYSLLSQEQQDVVEATVNAFAKAASGHRTKHQEPAEKLYARAAA